MKKILFIVQFPKDIAPSQRFRIELYANKLRDNNFHFDTEYFIDSSTRKIIYKQGFVFQKIWGTLKGFLRRLAGLLRIGKYDYIFIQREASPIGPPIFEWIYSKVLGKKIIYDFDDSLWLSSIPGNDRWLKFIKCFWKIKYICKWSYKISACNEYLYKYAIKYNNNVIINPTCVDTKHQHNKIKDQHSDKVSIGWTGSFSTLLHLDIVVEPLLELEKKYSFDLIVIADKNPQLPLKGFKFIKWNRESEIQDLLNCNIGIMPLTDLAFAEGKCGFKIIQFLSLGIPTVASPVGVNKEIIEEAVNGFLCTSKEQWYFSLEKLLVNAELRQRMGVAGRERIEKKYSVQSNTANFLSLFT